MPFSTKKIIEIMAYNTRRKLSQEKREKVINRTLSIFKKDRIIKDFTRNFGFSPNDI